MKAEELLLWCASQLMCACKYQLGFRSFQRWDTRESVVADVCRELDDPRSTCYPALIDLSASGTLPLRFTRTESVVHFSVALPTCSNNASTLDFATVTIVNASP